MNFFIPCQPSFINLVRQSIDLIRKHPDASPFCPLVITHSVPRLSVFTHHFWAIEQLWTIEKVTLNMFSYKVSIYKYLWASVLCGPCYDVFVSWPLVVWHRGDREWLTKIQLRRIHIFCFSLYSRIKQCFRRTNYKALEKYSKTFTAFYSIVYKLDFVKLCVNLPRVWGWLTLH